MEFDKQERTKKKTIQNIYIYKQIMEMESEWTQTCKHQVNNRNDSCDHKIT